MTVERVGDLFVYREAFAVAMALFEASRAWPREERYALTDQARRASRSVCANTAEAWAKRHYPKHFASKLSDAHAEAEETLTWIDFARSCGYLDAADANHLATRCRKVIGGLVRMQADRHRWCTSSP